jgi:Domain of unknown function (DUF5753)/Helix-turn-helix domain
VFRESQPPDKWCGKMMAMAGPQSGNLAFGHFGRQMKKERLAHGWTLPELSRRTGIDAAHLSRIERGVRPPTEKIAAACDAVFPGRRGWFSEYYEESKSWVPSSFRNWAEYEDNARSLRVWAPGIIHGLAQTADYAREVLAASQGVTEEIITARLAARTERQRRVLLREDPPSVWFIVDLMALYREAASPEVMAGQMGHLAELAAKPKITVTVMPAVIHPGNESGFIVADDSAAYAEHVAAGYVFTDDQTVSSLVERFDSLRAETYRASESLRIFERLGEIWAAGGSPLTAGPTGGTASR